MSLDIKKIRDDFPLFQKNLDGKPIIYFDNACMTLKPVQVITAMNQYYLDFPACAGRSGHKLAKKVDDEVLASRKSIQKFIGAKKTSEIIFTRNTTEGINLIANSLNLQNGDAVLISDKEHNSLLLPFQRLSEKGVKLKIFKFGDLEDLRSKLTKDVKLIATVQTSNADGSSQPIKEIINLAHINQCLVLIDAAQSIQHKEIDVQKLDIDFLVFSGHKLCGPTGTGVLYGKEKLLLQLKPFLIGGDTVKNSTYETRELEDLPARFEAGLQDYAGLIGLGAAVNYIQKIGIPAIEKHVIELNKYLSEELLKLGVEILGPQEAEKRSGVISFNIKGVQPHEIAGLLDTNANIAIRSGMHCVHSWFNTNKPEGSARASLYFYNTKEECDKFIEEIKKIISLVN